MEKLPANKNKIMAVDHFRSPRIVHRIKRGDVDVGYIYAFFGYHPGQVMTILKLQGKPLQNTDLEVVDLEYVEELKEVNLATKAYRIVFEGVPWGYDTAYVMFEIKKQVLAFLRAHKINGTSEAAIDSTLTLLYPPTGNDMLCAFALSVATPQEFWALLIDAQEPGLPTNKQLKLGNHIPALRSQRLHLRKGLARR